MTYLPPQEVEQASSLWIILADPSKYKKLLEDISAKDKELDVKKESIGIVYDEYRVKEQELTAREEAVNKQAAENAGLKEQLENSRIEQQLYQQTLRDQLDSVNQKTAELAVSQISFDQEYAKKSLELTNREKGVLKSEQDNQALQQETEKLKTVLEEKLNKLKAIL